MLFLLVEFLVTYLNMNWKLNHGKIVGIFFADHENFYDGRLFGEVSSEASVHLEDGVMTATIHAPDETYHIEVI